MTFTFTFHYLEIQKDANIHKGGATLITKCYVPGSTVTLLNPPQQGLHFFISHEELHFSFLMYLKTLPLSYSPWPQRTGRARGQNKQKQVASVFLSLFSFTFQRSVQTLDHTPSLIGLTQPQRLITAKPTKCSIMLCTMKKCKNMLKCIQILYSGQIRYYQEQHSKSVITHSKLYLHFIYLHFTCLHCFQCSSISRNICISIRIGVQYFHQNSLTVTKARVSESIRHFCIYIRICCFGCSPQGGLKAGYLVP